MCNYSIYIFGKVNKIFCYYRLAGAQAELDETMTVLKEKQDKLAAVEAKVTPPALSAYKVSVGKVLSPAMD